MSGQTTFNETLKSLKAQKSPGRLRIQLDFSEDSYSRLEQLTEDTHAESKAEVIRNGIRVYEWLAEQSKLGRFIEVLDADGKQVSRVEAKWFLR